MPRPVSHSARELSDVTAPVASRLMKKRGDRRCLEGKEKADKRDAVGDVTFAGQVAACDAIHGITPLRTASQAAAGRCRGWRFRGSGTSAPLPPARRCAADTPLRAGG